MGVQLREIVDVKKVDLKELAGRAVAFDGHNVLYQFISTIRGRRGEPLRDREGRITSHLNGLIYRNASLIEAGMRIVYVFDGKPPLLKAETLERRMEARREAMERYEEAVREGRYEAAKRYAQQASVTTPMIVDEAKRLLTLMGIPWIQAPSEGEAQSAHMAIKGDVWAVASQDFDSLLFGAPRLVRNLSITGRRKLPRKRLYMKIEPELIELERMLEHLGISREQLIDIGILVGTDYNPGGVRGIGPKRALRLIKEHGSLVEVLKHLEAAFPVSPGAIKQLFLNPEVTDRYELEWRPPDIDGVIEFLCDEHDFNEERVRRALTKIERGYKRQKERTTLERWFSIG